MIVRHTKGHMFEPRARSCQILTPITIIIGIPSFFHFFEIKIDHSRQLTKCYHAYVRHFITKITWVLRSSKTFKNFFLKLTKIELTVTKGIFTNCHELK